MGINVSKEAFMSKEIEKYLEILIRQLIKTCLDEKSYLPKSISKTPSCDPSNNMKGLSNDKTKK